MKCFKAPQSPVLSLLQDLSLQPITADRQASRNPILAFQGESEPPPHYHKARINPHSSQTQYLAERPHGLAKGTFSSSGQGSYSVGFDPSVPFKPGRKLIDTPNPIRENKVSRKKVTVLKNLHDPILQDDASFEPVRPRVIETWRPSPITEYEGLKRCFLPSELGAQRQSFYGKRNASSVFSDMEEQQNYQRRRVEQRPAETPALLQYHYALPYRDIAITEKPQHLHSLDETI